MAKRVQAGGEAKVVTPSKVTAAAPVTAGAVAPPKVVDDLQGIDIRRQALKFAVACTQDADKIVPLASKIEGYIRNGMKPS